MEEKLAGFKPYDENDKKPPVIKDPPEKAMDTSFLGSKIARLNTKTMKAREYYEAKHKQNMTLLLLLKVSNSKSYSHHPRSSNLRYSNSFFVLVELPNYIRYVSRFDTVTSTTGNGRVDACDQYSDSDLDDTKDDDEDVTRFEGTFGASSF